MPQYNEPRYIFGIHDPGGEHLMAEKGKKGWVLITHALGHDPNVPDGPDYTHLTNQGFGVIGRLNHGYGAQGTIPLPQLYDAFAARCANFVKNSKGGHIWIIGNEMNHSQERPQGQPITPELYAQCFIKCRQAIKNLPGHADDQVIIGAVAPWNIETKYPGNESGDWIKYFRDILELLRGKCDGIALHTYTHDHDPRLITSERKMQPPFHNYHYEFRAYRDFMVAIPPDMRDLPVYITETDQDKPWLNQNNGWVQAAYKEIFQWNSTPGNQQIRCLLLYRWSTDDQWCFSNKPGVIEDFKAALEHEYVWYPARPARPYAALFLKAEVPAAFTAGTRAQVRFHLRNVGSKVWRADGAHPVHLGYHWYTPDGQPVIAPEDLRASLPRDVAPGQEVQVQAQVTPPETPGSYILQWDLVEEGVTWFSAQGSTPWQSTVQVRPGVVTARFFPETKHTVRGIFLEFFNRYGLDICGYPITDEFEENGLRSQYFQRVALEEYEPKKVRLKLVGQEALASRKTIADLKAKVNDLQTQLTKAKSQAAELEARVEDLRTQLAQAQAGKPVIVPPPIKNVVETLPRHPSKKFPTRSRDQIQYLVITHTAISPDIPLERIAKYMVTNQDLPGITYHYYITADGTIYQTNKLETDSQRGYPQASKSVGIAFAGNFMTQIPTPAQLESGGKLCAYLLRTLNLPTSRVVGLRELLPTHQSPGDQWLSGQRWKDKLLERVNAALAAAPPVGVPAPPPVGIPAPPPTPARIPQPEWVDLVDKLKKHPTKRYGTRPLSQIKHLVIHHSAVPPSVGPERIANYHVDNLGWPGIGYHFEIAADGTIYKTNHLETVSYHAAHVNPVGVGICFAGNFTDTIPTEAQLKSGAQLCAYLLQELDLDKDSIKGHKEFMNTQCPGKQWLEGKKWKNLLLAQVEEVQKAAVAVPVEEKPLYHYVLFWQHPEQKEEPWARADWEGAINYIARFLPTCGFSVDDAMRAKYVTIIGGPLGVSEEAERMLREAGCKVERIAGESPEDTKRILDELAEKGQRFLTLQG